MMFRRCSALAALAAASFLCSTYAATPTASVTVVSLSDLDLDKNELGGPVSWTAPSDTTQVTKYNVYLATDALGAGKSVLQLDVPLGTNTISVAENTAFGSFMYVVVMTANAEGEQTNAPGSALLEDHVAVINSLSFTDLDLDTAHIGGTVAWTLRGTAPVSKYNVYLAEDGLGQDKVLLGEVVSGTSFDIVADTAYGTHSFICLYPASSLGEASNPSAIQFYDVYSPVRSLAFTDLDLDMGELGGQISWVAPLDDVEVTGYVVAYSTSAAGAGRDNLGNYGAGARTHVVPAGMVQGSYTYFNVYSASSLAEMTTPVSISIVDHVVNVDISFQDLDLDTNELGGVVAWTVTGDTSYVASYALYLATTAAGGFRSKVGTDSLDLERIVAAGTMKANYQYFVVYAESSLVQQSTPAYMAIADVASTPTDLSFSDEDATANFIGGVLAWSAPADVSQVVGYKVYWVQNSNGGSRVQGAEVPVGAPLQVSVPAGTAQGSYTAFAVYALSSLGEQSTPASLSIVDLSWTLGFWSSCSAACGNGTQTRSVACSSTVAGACGNLQQADTVRSCTNGFCSWNTPAWGACSKGCGEGYGTQTRTVACSSADEDECDMSTQPDATRSCSSYCSWTSDVWGACSKACGQGIGTETRNVSCSSEIDDACNNETEPHATRQCSSYCPWNNMPWSGCDCRTGTRSRKVICSASTEAECGSKPAWEEYCSTSDCGCHDNGDHDAMRPWGRDGGEHDMSCDTQWWLIFLIIVVSILLFCGCIALLVKLSTKKAVPPQGEATPVVPSQNETTVEKDATPVPAKQPIVIEQPIELVEI